MTPFQMIGLALVGILIALSVISVVRRRTRLRIGVVWILVWIVTGCVLIRPEITVVAARTLGIGRGADLVLYSAILMMMTGFFLIYLRARQQDATITKLVRHIAITEANKSNVGMGDDHTESTSPRHDEAGHGGVSGPPQ